MTKYLLIFFLIFCQVQKIKAQFFKDIEFQISASSGLSIPLGDFNQAKERKTNGLANTGYNYALEASSGKRVGLTAKIQRDILPIDQSRSYTLESSSGFDGYTVYKETISQFTSNESIELRTALIGPYLKCTTGKFQVVLAAQVGTSKTEYPSVIYYYEEAYFLNLENPEFDRSIYKEGASYNNIESSALAYYVDVKGNYFLSRNWSIFFSVGYFYSKQDHFISFSLTPEEGLTPGSQAIVINSDMHQLAYQVLNTNLGIAFKLNIRD